MGAYNLLSPLAGAESGGLPGTIALTSNEHPEGYPLNDLIGYAHNSLTDTPGTAANLENQIHNGEALQFVSEESWPFPAK